MPESAIDSAPYNRITSLVRNRHDTYGLGALLLYSVVSVLTFGRALIGNFRDLHVGMSTDPSLSTWFLAWWPHALTHRLNPFITNFVWAPGGINLTWTTSAPLLSLVVWPVTATAGPIAAFNLLCLVAPPLAGWTAFLLCRHVCHSWWYALLGGYIFGFSAYVLAHQSCGHLSLTLIFLVPLAVLVVARCLSGETTPTKTALMLAVIVAAQFLISAEVLATMTFIGGFALFLGWSFAPPDYSRRIMRVLLPVIAGYALSAVIVSPFLYAMFLHGGMPHGQEWSAEAYSCDLFNFIIPTQANAIGALSLIERLSAPFRSASIAETNGYVGLPLILVFMAFAWRHWREPFGKLLVDIFVITSIFALGPMLHIDGKALGGMPGKILYVIPILDKALPARFMMYSFLILAVLTCEWLAISRYSPTAKTGIAAAIVIFLLPNFSSSFWTRPVNTPAFFTEGLYNHYLTRGETVLPLPFGIRGNSMFWQVRSGMYFRMAGGYTGLSPSEFRRWPIVGAFRDAAYMPNASAQLKTFLYHHEVKAVIVSDDDPDAVEWGSLLSGPYIAKQSIGGITLYQIEPAALEPYAHKTVIELQREGASALFGTLVTAANRWLESGRSLAKLRPFEAQRNGLLPARWLIGPTTLPGWVTGGSVTKIDTNGRYFAGAWMGRAPDGNPGVGVYGPYAAFQPIIERYRPFAAHIYFPFPNDLLAPSHSIPAPKKQGLLLVVFSQKQLAEAAATMSAVKSQSPGDFAKPKVLSKAKVPGVIASVGDKNANHR